jgi:hypothetical protein
VLPAADSWLYCLNRIRCRSHTVELILHSRIDHRVHSTFLYEADQLRRREPSQLQRFCARRCQDQSSRVMTYPPI